MKIDPPLQKATLVKRYKRFLADVTLDSGELMTLHCPNTGSMDGCKTPGQPVWFSLSDNPKRKLPGTWEIIENEDNCLIGVNTSRANHLVEEAIIHGVIDELSGYPHLKREVKLDSGKSRLDFVLTKDLQQCFVEVKNVTLGGDNGQGFFPDAVTERGTKHLHELIQLKQQGARAVLLFCVQHTGIQRVSPAAHIDPKYAQTLAEAMNEGVEVLAYGAKLSPDEITLTIPVTVTF